MATRDTERSTHDQQREYKSFQAHVTSDGQVTIPAPIREILGLEQSDSVQVLIRRANDVRVVTREAEDGTREVVAEKSL